MKKHFLILTNLLLILTTGYGQTSQTLCEKGTWVFGLNPAKYNFFNTQETTNYTADTISYHATHKTNGISLGFNVGAGYFVRDNFCIGAGFGNTISFSLNTTLIFPTYLFARYYLMQKKHCFSFTKRDNTKKYAFFIQGIISGGYSVINSADQYNGTIAVKGKNTSYVYGGIAGIGYTYVVTKHIALELLSMYGNQIQSATVKDSQNGTTTKSNLNNNGFNLLLGIQTYF